MTMSRWNQRWVGNSLQQNFGPLSQKTLRTRWWTKEIFHRILIIKWNVTNLFSKHKKLEELKRTWKKAKDPKLFLARQFNQDSKPKKRINNFWDSSEGIWKTDFSRYMEWIGISWIWTLWDKKPKSSSQRLCKSSSSLQSSTTKMSCTSMRWSTTVSRIFVLH